MLVYLGPFCLFKGHLVYSVGTFDIFYIWYIFPRFGILYKEKSGNPARHTIRYELETRAGFFEVRKIIFILQMHCAIYCAVNFYSADVVIHDHRIATWRQSLSYVQRQHVFRIKNISPTLKTP
jgi:hypothetical protein